MSSIINFPANYVAFVGLAISQYAALNIFQIMNVSKHRKACGIKYPAVYASDADAAKDIKKMRFNCAQRAHQNTLEVAPMILACILYLGLTQPKLAGIFGSSFCIGRVFYTVGYSTGDPMARINAGSALQYPGLFGLILGSFYVTGQALYKLYA